MTPTDDPTLIADLVRAGVDAELVGRVANAIVSPIVRDLSRTDPKAYERDRKRAWRANNSKTKGSAEANDAAPAPKPVPDLSRTVPDKRCDLTSFLPSLSSLEDNQESKKEVVARARGTRLQPGWRPSANAIAAIKIKFDITDAEVESALEEFHDFWSGVPGSRGLKLNWPGTFRNRIRDTLHKIKARRKNGQGQGNIIPAADAMVERLRSLRGPKPGTLDLLGGEGAADVRLLPERRRE